MNKLLLLENEALVSNRNESRCRIVRIRIFHVKTGKSQIELCTYFKPFPAFPQLFFFKNLPDERSLSRTNSIR